MNEATRTLVEMSLRVRSRAATIALFKQTMTGVTERDINNIRDVMIGRGEISRCDPSPSHSRDIEPIDSNAHYRAFQQSAKNGSDDLHKATVAMFWRKAKQHGVSYDGARLATLYSHEELQRMSRVGLAA